MPILLVLEVSDPIFILEIIVGDSKPLMMWNDRQTAS